MNLRKLIPQILLILILLITFCSLSFSQVRQQYMRDFSYLSADLRDMQQKVDDFIEDFKRGDLKAFRYITYDVLERAVLQIKEESMRYKQQIVEGLQTGGRKISQAAQAGVPFMEYLMDQRFGNATRANLVKSALQGLSNLDPRVRLTAVHFLRKLRPDPSMHRIVKTAIGIDADWIAYDKRKRDFVFTPPKRMETIASRWEYYREKDLNWPNDVIPGQWGLNDHINAKQNDGLQGVATTDLSANRWGETTPQRNAEGGYVAMNAAQKAEYMKNVRQGRVQVRNADGTVEWVEPQKKDEVPFLPEAAYRTFHDDPNGQTTLLSDQTEQVGQFVPMGQGVKYTYVNCEGYRVVANPYAETMKLDEFITRIVWYNKIKQKQMNSLAIISKDTFSTLWRSIDGELPAMIPFLSTSTSTPMFDYTDVPVLVHGMERNKNLLTQWVIMRSLKDIYKHVNCPPQVKEDINVALWEAKREINRRSYVHGLVLTKESIRIGKLDAAAEHEREVAALEIKKGKDRDVKREVLGFKTPNTEIRANGYRLITANTTEEMDDRETKLSLRQLRENRIWAYKNENNDIIDYYRDKDRFYALQRQFHGNSANEVLNVNLIRRSQALINALLSGNADVWRTATWPEVETAVIMTLYRVLVKYEANKNTANYITTFMDQLRTQDPTVTDEASIQKDFPDNSYSDSKRNNIMRAALGGLFNRDPRIRLQCTHFLRRIGPTEDMLQDIIRARSVMATDSPVTDSPETDDYRSAFIDTNVYERSEAAMMQVPLYRYEGIDEPVPSDPSSTYGPIWVPKDDYTIAKYEYQMQMLSNIERSTEGTRLAIDYYGQYQLKAPSEELDKLYKFCLRDQLTRRIKNGQVEAITRMTRAEFSVLAETIDGEFILDIPFASFHSEPFASNQEITVQELHGTRVIEKKISHKNLGVADQYAIFGEKEISVIKKGIDCSNFLVQKGTAEYLIRFYNAYPALKADTKREIQDSLYFYKQDDIVVEEIVLAFEGQNPDGRAVIKVGTRLSSEMNPGGIRVYNSLPIGIRKDIRDAILDEQQEFPEALINILGVIGRRAPSVNESDRLDYQSNATGEREVVGRPPTQPEGFTSNNVRTN